MSRQPDGPKGRSISRPGPRSAGALAPPAPVRRIAPLRRLRREGLAPGVAEALLGCAGVLSEGEIRESGQEASYLGSTMITVDLARAAQRLRIDPGRDGSALADRVARNAEIRLLALRLARLEAERRAGDRLPGTMRAELQARAVGGALHIDVEIELPVDRGAGRRRLEGEQAP